VTAPRKRSGPPATERPPSTTTAARIPDQGIGSDGLSYRVSWRRDTWAAATWPKSRTFARRDDAARFLTKLQAGRPDLGRGVRVRLDHRPVGPWAEGWPS